MKRVLCILIFLSNFAFSQQRNNALWHFVVADTTTSKALDRVTISINNTRFFMTRLNGVVDIDKKLINPLDSIRVSIIGYKSKGLRVKLHTKLPDTIWLSPSVTILNEVRIGLTNSEIRIGDIKNTYNSHRIPNTDEEFAQFIPNTSKIKGIITSIEYMLHDELHGIEKPFRVRLFSKNKDSLFPDQELIKDSIIIYNSKKKRLVSVDIAKYDIQFPEDGVIAIFETLPKSYYGKDSIWYKGRGHLKMPGLDTDLEKKDEYPLDHDKRNRKTAYSMVGPVIDQSTFDDPWHQWYVFKEGNNFAITLTISKVK